MSKLRIPEQWSAQEALHVVGFLEDVIAAVWATHGAQMRGWKRDAARLLAAREPPPMDPDAIDWDDPENEIPF